MIDILYVAYNRLEMTVESFTALTRNTNWRSVRRLYIHDDGSTDGTSEYLDAARHEVKAETVFQRKRLKGPVSATNWYLDRADGEVDRFAKIDNDFVVCMNWLSEMLKVMTAHPGIQILGTEPMTGAPTPVKRGDKSRGILEARHIGGKGIIRLSAFSHCRPRPGGFNGYQGFTQWQEKHPEITKAWITPDLPCFGLDQLPFEPWQSLAEYYEQKKWARRWGPYSEEATGYWGWWTPVQAAMAVA